jgi:hypothetical protein
VGESPRSGSISSSYNDGLTRGKYTWQKELGRRSLDVTCDGHYTLSVTSGPCSSRQTRIKIRFVLYTFLRRSTPRYLATKRTRRRLSSHSLGHSQLGKRTLQTRHPLPHLVRSLFPACGASQRVRNQMRNWRGSFGVFLSNERPGSISVSNPLRGDEPAKQTIGIDEDLIFRVTLVDLL